MELASSVPPLGKYLASSGKSYRAQLIPSAHYINLDGQDKKTRDTAIKSLSTFLANNSQEPLPKSELGKLWKGLFYCMHLGINRGTLLAHMPI